MKPILYAPDESSFVYNGLGVLSDTLAAPVTNEINGSYTAVLEYPVNGIFAEYLLPKYCVKLLANDTDAPQVFRINKVNNTLRGTKSVELVHISYDLLGRPINAFTAAGASAAVAAIETNALIPTGFTFSTNLTSAAQYTITTPRSARAVLGGAEGSLIDIYHGELYFDNFRVSLLDRIGSDRGVTVRYGKNLTELEQEIDGSATGNGILPFWYRESDGLVVPSSASTADWLYGFNCYKTVDVTDQFNSKPTAAQLTAYADTLVNSIITPEQSLSVSFVTLHQLKEYDTIAALERAALGDTVGVVYQVIKDNKKKLDINIKTRAVKTVFNPLTEQYISIELGTLRTTLADYILNK